MEEIWKPVKGYDGIYDISNYGQLYSHPRSTTKGGYTYGLKRGNYLYYSLSKDGKEIAKMVHQWMWITFVGAIPEGYDVHHINGNNKDNRLENLELIEHTKHLKLHYKEKGKKMVKAVKDKCSKPVLQYTLNGEFVAEYKSAADAERQTGICNSNITACCKGRIKKGYKVKTAGGYIWKYKEIA